MTHERPQPELNSTVLGKTVPWPNCNAKLERKAVTNEASPNVGGPFATCDQCSANEMICFSFLDYGECNLCGCPMYQGPAKKGRHVGRMFEACSQGCSGKFRWLDVLNDGI